MKIFQYYDRKRSEFEKSDKNFQVLIIYVILELSQLFMIELRKKFSIDF